MFSTISQSSQLLPLFCFFYSVLLLPQERTSCGFCRSMTHTSQSPIVGSWAWICFSGRFLGEGEYEISYVWILGQACESLILTLSLQNRFYQQIPDSFLSHFWTLDMSLCTWPGQARKKRKRSQWAFIDHLLWARPYAMGFFMYFI